MAEQRADDNGWNPERVIAELKRLKRSGVKMTSGALKAKGHRPVVQAAIRHFGSWNAARAKAGVVPSDTRQVWSKERVLSTLAELDAAGQRMTASALKKAGRGQLVSACYRHFGNIENARLEASIDAPEPLPKPRTLSSDEAAEALCTLTAQYGGFVSAKDLPATLAAALRDRYGSVAKARAKLGLARRSFEIRWSRESVIDELRRLAAEGVPLTLNALNERGRADLINAAYRHVGSFQDAKTEAQGHGAPTTRWTKKKVLAALRSLRKDGLQLTGPRLKAEGHGELLAAARRLYGGIVAARAALDRD